MNPAIGEARAEAEADDLLGLGEPADQDRVEPEARGLGVGTALLETCVRFAEACGYARIVLWTQDFSTVARRLYARHGFQRRESYPDVSCGRSLVIERWERKVRA